MKKLLATVLAAVMSLSISVTVFAEPETCTTFTIDLTADADTPYPADPKVYFLNIPGEAFLFAATPSTIGAEVDKMAHLGVYLDGLKYTSSVSGNILTFTATTKGEDFKVTANDTYSLLYDAGHGVFTSVIASKKLTSYTNGTATGSDKFKEEKAAVLDSTPYVESLDDMNDTGGVKADKTVYFLVKGDYGNPGLFELTATKGDDAKAIRKISIAEEKLGELYNVNDGSAAAKVDTYGNKRHTFVKVELAENYTDTEFKIGFDLKIKAVKDIPPYYTKGDSYKFQDITKMYVKNTKETIDDTTYSAGTSGVVVKPVKNQDNTIEWEDENNTIAMLDFEADSNVTTYYPKLSTKWKASDYAKNFEGTDAFICSFIGNPTISSTSRPVLTLVSPFVDEDGEETVAPEEVVIYEVVDGALIDVTSKFSIGENDDGNTVFTTKTRTLGTYILSNGTAAASV